MELSEAATSNRPVRLADGDEFDAFIEEKSVALVEFYTSGCGICQRMEPVLGIVAKATEASVALINAGDDLDLSGRYTIRSVPTLLLFKNGEVVGRLDDGYQDAESLVAFVEESV